MDANRHMRWYKQEESLNVFSFSAELQGGSEEIPEQVFHHDAQTEGEEARKALSCLCLVTVKLGANGKFLRIAPQH